MNSTEDGQPVGESPEVPTAPCGLLGRIRDLATKWATQPNDYDEDTEQQIEDGRAILALLDGDA